MLYLFRQMNMYYLKGSSCQFGDNVNILTARSGFIVAVFSQVRLLTQRNYPLKGLIM